MTNINTDDCWIFAKAKGSRGYGTIFSGGKTYSVHRVMWEFANDMAIPKELEIDHLCRVKSCCNPIHLEAVTHKENLNRVPPYRRNGGNRNLHLTHCHNGHEFTLENTYFYTGKYGHKRQCRVCNRVRERIRRANTLVSYNEVIIKRNGRNRV